METEVSDADNPFSVEGDSLILDLGLDTDSYDVPDPGLLKEKNESSFSELVPQFFASSSRWQNVTPRVRARQLWLLLRTGLHDLVEKEKRAELHMVHLTHGLELLRRLEVAAGLRWVAQDPVGRCFVVLDRKGRLHLHREDGWGHKKLLAPVPLSGLVAVLGPLGTVGRFVGWGPTGLSILRPDLSLLWLSKPGVGKAPGHEPICCLPVPDARLLLVAEAGGGLALWKFCSGGCCLVPHGPPLQPPPSTVGALESLALAPLPPHRILHCFAAYGSTVLTFDLRTWALIDVRQDLHKTTISDLAYCREVDAMVTAAQDSTVKVWEADWQIRMVFVGHTGPVTAMTILPNTSLVLSASQDGTLRTWDLQAAAQVGEVALSRWSQEVPSRRVNRLLAPAGPGWPVLSLRASSVELWRLQELYSPLAQLSAPVLHLQAVPPLPAPAHPPLPARLVCACADGSVYLVSVATGRTVSVLLLEPDDCAAAVAYCLPREALWLLTRAGHLVCANAARCPMRVLHRVCPPPSPAPRPCCLHLYSHLTDPSSAFANWETVRQHKGELCRSDTGQACKDKNRYLPVVGHTDGALSVLGWHWLKTVFRTEAHSPGPVTAIASTRNSVVTSGGDLTVKMWCVFPYAEESLSLLRTFSCCHPAMALCALGKRVTVGFEDPDSATYGLVQYGLGDSRRYDHQPQDDPTDRITGLCCCPTLKVSACSSLDRTIRIWTAENRLLRLLQLNGAPQALTFCSNSGDLVLALGSRLCLVSHRLYLPTSYLVENLCQKIPDVVDDPPLPLTGQESLTSAQLQRLANLHGGSSFSTGLSFIHHRTATPRQPVLEEDLEAFLARDQDLQQLRQELVVPAAQPSPSWHQRQKAFDNYLHLIYGPGLMGLHGGEESQQWGTVALTVERGTWDVCAPPRAGPSLRQAGVRTEAPAAPRALPPQDEGALSQHFTHPPQTTHYKLLAGSSLSCDLGLSLDLQLQSEQLRGEKPVALDPPSSLLQHRCPLLLKRRPKELLSNLGGFFPAAVEPSRHCLRRPMCFPGCIPNSVVLQQMWLPGEPGASQDNLWQLRGRRQRHAKRPQQLIQRLGDEQEEDEEEEPELVWSSDSLSPHRQPSDQLLGPKELEAQSSEHSTPKPTRSHDGTRTEAHLLLTLPHHGRLLCEAHYGHLPRFLHSFVTQNWFKRLFPIFTLEAYPEVGTVEGLASLFVDLLGEASWADRVHVLQALLRLLPGLSRDLCSRLQGILVHLLNLDQPPSLEDKTQKRFVMLALQLLLACSLESREVVLELMSYFLYSPAHCRTELKELLGRLGLQDPQGVLSKEMMTWVQGPDCDKAALRERCCQKLEEMMQRLQGLPAPLSGNAGLCDGGGQPLPWAWRVLHWPPSPQKEVPQPPVAEMPETLPRVPEASAPPPPPEEAMLQISMASGAPVHISVTPPVHSWTPSLVVSPGEPDAATPEPPAQQMLSHTHVQKTRRTLSETLLCFSTLPETHLRSSVPAALPDEPLPLDQTDRPQSRMLDLGPIDALNYFCQQQQARQQVSLQEPENLRPRPGLRPLEPNTVVPQPWDHQHHSILRLQEAKVPRFPRRQKGLTLSWLGVGRTLEGSIRTLKLPLPRVELQPFPPDWPRPARPLPPLPLQPTLQRYFLPGNMAPDSYS
ncbi:WD repeat-containing protein 97 [Manis pentadactyla]|uniref:WD repeat-containing protein 97 n=1 Tax=Manis pentadactyla TaxID=143292 RepID=UPI00255C3334|nr:WD repeat-containing protein 97 [Manis pentadactyla]